MTLERRDEIIADMLEYFNARPITLSNDYIQVICLENKTNKWLFVDLETTDSRYISEDEASEYSKKWLAQTLLINH
jgi:hypothetical protein